MKQVFLYTSLGTAFFSLLFTGHCMLPLGSKTYTNQERSAKGNRIKYTAPGATLLFSMLPLGETIDLKVERANMRKQFKCQRLVNVDTTYFDYTIFIVGWERVIIKADCIKADEPGGE